MHRWHYLFLSIAHIDTTSLFFFFGTQQFVLLTDRPGTSALRPKNHCSLLRVKMNRSGGRGSHDYDGYTLDASEIETEIVDSVDEYFSSDRLVSFCLPQTLKLFVYSILMNKKVSTGLHGSFAEYSVLPCNLCDTTD